MRRPDEFLPYDELRFGERMALTPSKNTDPLIYIDPTGKRKAVERWWIGNMVGGATMLWEADLPRYTASFALLDVMKQAPAGTSLVNWPWTYDEFQPWFEMAEWEWGISGQARRPTRSTCRSRCAAATSFRCRRCDRMLRRRSCYGRSPRGMKPFPSPRGINTRTYNGRPACPYCGYCQSFGCAVNDRASSTNTVLAQALQTGVHAQDRALRHPHPALQGPRRRRGVQVRPGRRRADHQGQPRLRLDPGDQSARMLLISGIPDPNKLVGRYFTYHTEHRRAHLQVATGLGRRPAAAVPAARRSAACRCATSTSSATRSGPSSPRAASSRSTIRSRSAR